MVLKALKAMFHTSAPASHNFAQERPSRVFEFFIRRSNWIRGGFRRRYRRFLASITPRLGYRTFIHLIILSDCLIIFSSPNPLSFDSTFCIKRSWLAICAEVIDNFEFLYSGHITMLIDIVAFGMLLGVTQVAVHRVSIVFSKSADALYNVFFNLITRRMRRTLWVRSD